MRKLFLIILALVIVVSVCECRKNLKKSKLYKKPNNDKLREKQFLTDLETRETNPPNFVRLLVMRLIYGIASQMGFEERLQGFLNGAFVPPGADDGDYDLFDGGDDDDGGDLFDE